MVQIETDRGIFSCNKVIVTAGAWINRILAGLGVHVPVTVTQEQVTFFATPNVKDFTKKKYFFLKIN